MRQRALVAYFTIAYAGTRLTILPFLLSSDGLGLFAYRFRDAGILLALLGTLSGPLRPASVVTAVSARKAGVRPLLQCYRRWLVGLRRLHAPVQPQQGVCQRTGGLRADGQPPD